MTKPLVYAYSPLLFLCCLSGALSLTSGPLPGCRSVVRPTHRWNLPTSKSTPNDIPNWQKAVCSVVKYTTPYRVGVDESLSILKDGLSKFSCPNDNTTTYCVASNVDVAKNYRIVKCGDLGCMKATGWTSVDYCSPQTTIPDCAYRRTAVAVKTALSDLDSYWEEVFSGMYLWVTRNSNDSLTIVSEIGQKKGTIMNTIRQKVGSSTTLSTSTFSTIVKQAINAAVPMASRTLLGDNKKMKQISVQNLVWDIMNWDLFLVDAY